MMPADARPFLAAIADVPDDDLPRLALADFLDERGEAERAEFIRLQLALHPLPEAQKPAEWLRREKQLLARYRTAWMIPGLRGHQIFRRGFVECLWTTAERLLAMPGHLGAYAPVRELRIVNAASAIGPLATLPDLDRIEILDLRNSSLGAAGRMRSFFRTAKLGRLRSLRLYMNILDSDDLLELADSPVAPQLKELDVSGNPFGVPGIEALAAEKSFAGLETLIARADEMPFYDCITPRAGEVLAASKTLVNLRRLDLGDHYLEDDGTASIAGAANAAKLEFLGLAYNDVAEAGIASIVESPRLGRLAHLELRGNKANAVTIDRLLAWPRLPAMATIDLRETDLDAGSLHRMMASPHAAKFLFDTPELGRAA